MRVSVLDVHDIKVVMASSSYFLHFINVAEQFFTAAVTRSAAAEALHILTLCTVLLRLKLSQQEQASALEVVVVVWLPTTFTRHSWAPALNLLMSSAHSEIKVMFV